MNFYEIRSDPPNTRVVKVVSQGGDNKDPVRVEIARPPPLQGADHGLGGGTLLIH